MTCCTASWAGPAQYLVLQAAVGLVSEPHVHLQEPSAESSTPRAAPSGTHSLPGPARSRSPLARSPRGKSVSTSLPEACASLPAPLQSPWGRVASGRSGSGALASGPRESDPEAAAALHWSAGPPRPPFRCVAASLHVCLLKCCSCVTSAAACREESIDRGALAGSEGSSSSDSPSPESTVRVRCVQAASCEPHLGDPVCACRRPGCHRGRPGPARRSRVLHSDEWPGCHRGRPGPARRSRVLHSDEWQER